MIPDFEGVDEIGTIMDRFVPAAKKIMLEHKLVYEGRSWSITALELYLWKASGKWCDPCTDGKNKTAEHGQAKPGTWYLKGKSPKYGGPNRCRIDITAGNGGDIFAGLLVRELDERDGSAIALQKIIRGQFYSHKGWTSQESAKLTAINGSSVIDGPLKLVPVEPTPSPIWYGPRMFNQAKNEKKVEYLKYPLRVATSQTKKSVGQKVWKEWKGSFQLSEHSHNDQD